MDVNADRFNANAIFATGGWYHLALVKSGTHELNVTILTTLLCNFACDYCFQGDHGDYNKFAEKMSLETAVKVGTG